MLIINADDWGQSVKETDAALACFQRGSVTSVSAMVFMEDAERAAKLAREHGVDAGLHLNLDQPYTGQVKSRAAAEAHERIARFMKKSKYAVLLYNPLLKRAFRDVYQSQADEFERLFGAPPTHVDGHHHRHLCANMLFDEVIPRGQRVRRNFTFLAGEKGALNRSYRRFVDGRLTERYKLTDYLFNLADCGDNGKWTRVLELAKTARVELETHPSKPAEYKWLMSDAFRDEVSGVRLAPYSQL